MKGKECQPNRGAVFVLKGRSHTPENAVDNPQTIDDTREEQYIWKGAFYPKPEDIGS